MKVINTPFHAAVKETGTGEPYIYIEEMDSELGSVIEHLSLSLNPGTSYLDAVDLAKELNMAIDHINFNLK